MKGLASIFILILLLQFSISYYSQHFLLTDELYRVMFGGQMNEHQFSDFLITIKKWQWISYAFMPVVVLLQISFTWVCLKFGSFFAEDFNQTPIWKICLWAQVVFAIGIVLSTFYTAFISAPVSLEQFSVNPFSLMAILGKGMPKWSQYFFNTINLFEIGYVFFLAYLLSKEASRSFRKSLVFVLSTYLPGLTVWILVVTYLSILFNS